jgi:hypothetical protein
LRKKVENNELITKADLARQLQILEGQLITEHKADMAAAVDSLKADMAATADRLTEQMRDMQTELLKVFLPFREQVANREAILETRLNASEARQGILENRLWEIEKRLLMNPPKPH